MRGSRMTVGGHEEWSSRGQQQVAGDRGGPRRLLGSLQAVGQPWVNPVLHYRTSWSLEYADMHCESIKRGCLVQRFPNLSDHRYLFFLQSD